MRLQIVLLQWISPSSLQCSFLRHVMEEDWHKPLQTISWSRDVTDLFQSRLEAVCHNTVETLKDAGVDDSTISTVKDSILAQCEPFKGLETEYHQNAYIRDHFGLIVSILCQSSYRWQRQLNLCREKCLLFLIVYMYISHIDQCMYVGTPGESAWIWVPGNLPWNILDKWVLLWHTAIG